MHRPADRGVSPLVGAALLVVVAVVTVLVVGVGALDAAPGFSEERPAAQFGVSYDADTGNITFTHVAGRPLYGDRVFVEDSRGNRVNWTALHPNGSDAIEGRHVTFDGKSGGGTSAGAADAVLDEVCTRNDGYEYRLVRRTPPGERIVLRRIRLSTAANC